MDCTQLKLYNKQFRVSWLRSVFFMTIGGINKVWTVLWSRYKWIIVNNVYLLKLFHVFLSLRSRDSPFAKSKSAHTADDSSDVKIAEDFPALTFDLLPTACDLSRSPEANFAKATSAHAADDSSDVMIAEDFPALTFDPLSTAGDVARSPLSFDSSG